MIVIDGIKIIGAVFVNHIRCSGDKGEQTMKGFDRIQDQSPDFIGGVIYANACVQDAPSIDIVRCRECKRFGDEGWCFWRDVRIEPDDFCSYGERMESE